MVYRCHDPTVPFCDEDTSLVLGNLLNGELVIDHDDAKNSSLPYQPNNSRNGAIMVLHTLNRPFVKNVKKILSMSIGGYFIVVSMFKIFSFQSLLQAVQNFGVLPPSLLVHFSIFIVLVELVGGIALVLDVFRKFFSRMLTGTVVLFTIAILINLIRGNFIDCGCYGSMVATSIGWWHVLHNIILCSLLYGIDILSKREAMPIVNQEIK